MDKMTLLDLLANNPRASVTDLADILNESEEEVKKGIEDLEKNKIICGYHTVINWDKTNSEHVDAMIGVSAKPERNTGYDKIGERIARFPEVSSIYLMSGTYEFMVSVNAKTMREVADFVGEKLAPLDGIISTVTMFILKKYKVNGVLVDVEPEEDERQLISA